VGNAVFNTAVQFFLLVFYTDGALIAPALASSAMLIGKIWDAVNDPLFGWVSDRTVSRFGKRRVYMIFGALPLAVFAALLWFVPRGMGNTLTFVWIAGSFILFDTFMTITSTPYYALTAELTQDYNERSSLTAYRMIFGVAAFMIGAAATPFIVGLFPSKSQGYGVIGILYGAITAIVLWVSASGFRERRAINAIPQTTSPLRSFLLALKNRAFLQLIVAYLIAQIGFTLVQTLMAYFLAYQMNMAAQVPLVMLLLLVMVILFIFPWKWLADRWNKGPAYALGLGIAGVSIAASFFLPHAPSVWIYVLAAVAGIGFSANWVFPWAMIPDVVEFDQLETGEPRGGMYYGVWGFASKLTAALGITISGWVLQLGGYVPNVDQSTRTLTAIRTFFGPVPAVFFALALPLLFFYPISRASHAEILRKLAAKGQALVD
jgi:GPH family glycoside/pentoside/hexuronide:cation symporter